MNIDHAHVESWLASLKKAWEEQRPEDALKLFEETTEYYERPFHAGTTFEEYRTYWQDIVGIENITFDYEIFSIENNRASVRWQNTFNSPEEGGKYYHLDGAFFLEFNSRGNCAIFRQWWFMKDS